MSDKLFIEKINYKYEDLSPVMSKDTLKYHRDNLAKGYVKRYNAGEGDAKFNEAGAFLHNIFFPQLKAPSSSNKPHGKCKEIIDSNWGSFDSFKKDFEKIAMGIQGSGWVYLSKSGKIKTIKNHQIKNDILLLIDWWEHAWALDYQSDKKKYLSNMWKIIDWDVINHRASTIKRASQIYNILKSSKG